MANLTERWATGEVVSTDGEGVPARIDLGVAYEPRHGRWCVLVQIGDHVFPLTPAQARLIADSLTDCARVTEASALRSPDEGPVQ